MTDDRLDEAIEVIVQESSEEQKQEALHNLITRCRQIAEEQQMLLSCITKLLTNDKEG